MATEQLAATAVFPHQRPVLRSTVGHKKRRVEEEGEGGGAPSATLHLSERNSQGRFTHEALRTPLFAPPLRKDKKKTVTAVSSLLSGTKRIFSFLAVDAHAHLRALLFSTFFYKKKQRSRVTSFFFF